MKMFMIRLSMTDRLMLNCKSAEKVVLMRCVLDTVTKCSQQSETARTAHVNGPEQSFGISSCIRNEPWQLCPTVNGSTRLLPTLFDMALPQTSAVTTVVSSSDKAH